jgi:glycosyltransferase involved in cell wall biosynthesis
LTDHVTFPGKTNHIGNYLQLMDIFVVPSGPEEAFGNSAVESMALGIPTIVFSDGGGLVEHIEDNVTGYVVNDVDELRERLQQLAASSELRRRLGDAGRQHVLKKYGLEAMVVRYNEFYASRIGMTKNALRERSK